MRHIEIQFDDLKITARLLDDKAPKLCQALWDIMPIEDTVAHAQWSGEMFHTVKNNWLEWNVERFENRGGFQAPGDIVFSPSAREFAVSYGESQFRWVTGNAVVATVAVVEGDLKPLAKKAAQLIWDGAKKMEVRRKNAKEKTIEIDLDGITVEAQLWEDKAPKLVKAIWKSLPLKAQATNDTWSGQMVHFSAKISRPQGKLENVSFLPNAGDIFFVPGDGGLRFVYGQGQIRAAEGAIPAARVGKIHGDLTAFAAKANQMQYDAAKKFIVRRKE